MLSPRCSLSVMNWSVCVHQPTEPNRSESFFARCISSQIYLICKFNCINCEWWSKAFVKMESKLKDRYVNLKIESTMLTLIPGVSYVNARSSSWHIIDDQVWKMHCCTNALLMRRFGWVGCMQVRNKWHLKWCIHARKKQKR